MNQVPVKWCWDYELKGEGCFPTKSTYAGHNTPVPVVPLSSLREVVELVQALDRMCAAHKIQDPDAHAVIQRLLAGLGEVGE